MFCFVLNFWDQFGDVWIHPRWPFDPVCVDGIRLPCKSNVPFTNCKSNVDGSRWKTSPSFLTVILMFTPITVNLTSVEDSSQAIAQLIRDANVSTESEFEFLMKETVRVKWRKNCSQVTQANIGIPDSHESFLKLDFQRSKIYRKSKGKLPNHLHLNVDFVAP